MSIINKLFLILALQVCWTFNLNGFHDRDSLRGANSNASIAILKQEFLNDFHTSVNWIEKYDYSFQLHEAQKLGIENQIKGSIIFPFFEESINLESANYFAKEIIFQPIRSTQLNLWGGVFSVNPSSQVRLNERKINGQKKYLPFSRLIGDFKLNIEKSEISKLLTFDTDSKNIESFKKHLKLNKDKSIEIQIPKLEWELDPFNQKMDQVRIVDYNQAEAYIKIGRKKYPVFGLILEKSNKELKLSIKSEKGDYEFQIDLIGIQKDSKQFELEKIEIDHKKREVFTEFPINGNKLTIPFLKLNLELSGKSVKGTALNGWDCSKIKEIAGTGQAKGLDLSEFKTIDQSFLDALEVHRIKVNSEIETATKDGTATNFELPIDLTSHLSTFLGKYLTTNKKNAFPKETQLILVGLSLNSDNSKATAKLILTIKAYNQVFVFGAANVAIEPDKVGFTDLKLFTTQSYEIEDNNLLFSILKKMDDDANTGSYAELSCDGFVGFNLQANYKYYFKLNKKGDNCNAVAKEVQIVNTNDLNEIEKQRNEFLKTAACRPVMKQQFTLPFIITGKDLVQFKGPINIGRIKNPFLLNKFESILFHPVEGYVYKSSPLEKFDSKNNLTKKISNLFKNNFTGVHLSKVDLQIFGIGNGKKGKDRKPFKLTDATNFFITAGGLTGSHHVSGMDQKIDIGGWGTILESFKFEVENNIVGTPFNQEALTATYLSKNGGAYIGGKIVLPVVNEKNEDNWMAFSAGLGYDDISKFASAFLRIEESELGKEFDLPMWGAFKMQIGTNVDAPTAAITLHLNQDSGDFWNASEFEPFANFSGIFKVDFQGSKPTSSGFYKEEGFMPFFNVPSLSFTDWKINDPDIYNRCQSSQGAIGGIKNMSFGSFGVGGAGGAGTVNQDGSNEIQQQIYSGLQGKGLSIWDVNFNCNAPDSKEGYKIDFELHVNLIGNLSDQKKTEFQLNKDQVSGQEVNSKQSASTASANAGKGGSSQTTLGGAASKASKQKPKKISELKIVGQLQVHTKYTESSLDFWKVTPEAFLINAEFSIFDFKGGFVLINDDPVFGKGFKGYVDLLIGSKGQGFGFKTVMQYGKTDYNDATGQEGGDDLAYEYGFFDLEAFSQKGWMIPKTPIFLHGAGGGVQINMIAEDTSPGESFNSARKKKSKNVGEVSHNSGILSEQADPYGYLLPGKSLSGLIFKPRSETFGFGGKMILSLGGNALLAWGDLGFNLSFTKDFVPLKANLRGNAYLLTPPDDDCQGPNCPPIGDPSEASGLGAMEAELNMEKGYFIATASLEVEYPGGSSQETGDKHLDRATFVNTGKTKKLPDDIQLFSTRVFGEANFILAWKDPTTTVDIPLEKAGEWQLLLGSPTEGVGQEFKFLGITLARMEAYLQAGHHLDPIPSIADLVPEWDQSDASAGKTRKSDPNFAKISDGKGIIFGAKFKIPDNTVEFLMFRARLAAGAGFDLSLLSYSAAKAKKLNCSDGDGKFGLNNWYAKGQAYAYLKAVLDIHINLIFIDEWFNIFDAYAAAVIQAELPNPTWLRAMVKARFSVLNGAITGKVNFKAEIGNRCKTNQSLVADMPIISEIIPDNQSTEVAVYQHPEISFNFPVNKPVVITEYIEDDDDVKTKERTFRAHLKKFEVREKGSNQKVIGKFSYATDNYSATFIQASLLKPNKEYEIIAEAAWEEYKSGRWAAYIYEGKPYVEKTDPTIYTFKTGGLPTQIARDMLEYQAPGYGQRFWHEGYAVPQLLFKQDGNSFFFSNNTTQLKKDYPNKAASLPDNVPLVYQVELTEYDANNGEIVAVQTGELGQFPGKSASITKYEVDEKQGDNLNYAIPYIKPVVTNGKSVTYADWDAFKVDQSKKGKYFKLAIKRSPKTAYNPTVASNIQTENQEKNYNESGKEQSSLGGESAGASITKRVTKLKSKQVPAGQALMYETLYEYHFSISEYNSLYEKLADFGIQSLDEKFAKPQLKYDHPNEEKVFDPLPLVSPYKDHHFVVKGGKEGLDLFDQQKLIANLRVASPIGFDGMKTNDPIIHKTNPHPFESLIYLKSESSKNVTIPIKLTETNAIKNRLSPKNVKLLDDETEFYISLMTRTLKALESIGAVKSSYIIDGKIGIGRSLTTVTEGKLGYEYFFEAIPTMIYQCNENLKNVKDEDDKALKMFQVKNISNNMASWLDLTKSVLTPYYMVNFKLPNDQLIPWGFQLQFNDDATLKQFDKNGTPFSFSKELMAYKQPKGKIEGITDAGNSNKSFHFDFVDRRERILKNQFDLVRSLTFYSIMQSISTISFPSPFCGQGDLISTIHHFMNMGSLDSGVKTTDFENKYVTWTFPKFNRWRTIGETPSEANIKAAPKKVFKLPLKPSGSNIASPLEEKATTSSEIFVNKTSQSYLLDYPDQSLEITKIVITEKDPSREGLSDQSPDRYRTIHYWDDDIKEDHNYSFDSKGKIQMEIATASPKYAGLELIKSNKEFVFYIQLKNGKKLKSLDTPKLDASTGFHKYGFKEVSTIPDDYDWLGVDYDHGNKTIKFVSNWVSGTADFGVVSENKRIGKTYPIIIGGLGGETKKLDYYRIWETDYDVVLGEVENLGKKRSLPTSFDLGKMELALNSQLIAYIKTTSLNYACYPFVLNMTNVSGVQKLRAIRKTSRSEEDCACYMDAGLKSEFRPRKYGQNNQYTNYSLVLGGDKDLKALIDFKNNSGPFTMEFRVKQKEEYPSSATSFAILDASERSDFNIHVEGKKIKFSKSDQMKMVTIKGDKELPLINDYFLVTIRYQGKTLEVYVNGARYFRKEINEIINLDGLFIDGPQLGSGNGKGYLDYVTIWDHAVDACTIQKVMFDASNSLKHLVKKGVKANYEFDEIQNFNEIKNTIGAGKNAKIIGLSPACITYDDILLPATTSQSTNSSSSLGVPYNIIDKDGMKYLTAPVCSANRLVVWQNGRPISIWDKNNNYPYFQTDGAVEEKVFKSMQATVNQTDLMVPLGQNISSGTAEIHATVDGFDKLLKGKLDLAKGGILMPDSKSSTKGYSGTGSIPSTRVLKLPKDKPTTLFTDYSNRGNAFALEFMIQRTISSGYPEFALKSVGGDYFKLKLTKKDNGGSLILDFDSQSNNNKKNKTFTLTSITKTKVEPILVHLFYDGKNFEVYIDGTHQLSTELGKDFNLKGLLFSNEGDSFELGYFVGTEELVDKCKFTNIQLGEGWSIRKTYKDKLSIDFNQWQIKDFYLLENSGNKPLNTAILSDSYFDNGYNPYGLGGWLWVGWRSIQNKGIPFSIEKKENKQYLLPKVCLYPSQFSIWKGDQLKMIWTKSSGVHRFYTHNSDGTLTSNKIQTQITSKEVIKLLIGEQLSGTDYKVFVKFPNLNDVYSSKIDFSKDGFLTPYREGDANQKIRDLANEWQEIVGNSIPTNAVRGPMIENKKSYLARIKVNDNFILGYVLENEDKAYAQNGDGLKTFDDFEVLKEDEKYEWANYDKNRPLVKLDDKKKHCPCIGKVDDKMYLGFLDVSSQGDAICTIMFGKTIKTATAIKALYVANLGTKTTGFKSLTFPKDNTDDSQSSHKWELVVDGKIPNNAVQGATLENKPTYVTRDFYRQGKFGGWTIHGQQDKSNQDQYRTHFEVLKTNGKNYNWAYVQCGEFPTNAVVAGKEGDKKVCPCLVKMENQETKIGGFLEGSKNCIVYGNDKSYEDFKILVDNSKMVSTENNGSSTANFETKPNNSQNDKLIWSNWNTDNNDKLTSYSLYADVLPKDPGFEASDFKFPLLVWRGAARRWIGGELRYGTFETTTHHTAYHYNMSLTEGHFVSCPENKKPLKLKKYEVITETPDYIPIWEKWSGGKLPDNLISHQSGNGKKYFPCKVVTENNNYIGESWEGTGKCYFANFSASNVPGDKHVESAEAFEVLTYQPRQDLALVLNNDKEFVEISIAKPKKVEKTIEFWIQFDDLSQKSISIFGDNFITLEAGQLKFRNTQYKIPFTLQTKTWYHLAFTGDADNGTGVKIYLNGQEVARDRRGNTNINKGKYKLGGFKGKVDNFRIWDRGFSQAEIKKLALEKVVWSSSNLIVNFPFNGNKKSKFITNRVVFSKKPYNGTNQTDEIAGRFSYLNSTDHEKNWVASDLPKTFPFYASLSNKIDYSKYKKEVYADVSFIGGTPPYKLTFSDGSTYDCSLKSEKLTLPFPSKQGTLKLQSVTDQDGKTATITASELKIDFDLNNYVLSLGKDQNDFLEIPAFKMPNKATISFLIKCTKLTPSERFILGTSQFKIGIDKNYKLYFENKSFYGSKRWTNANAIITDGKWHKVIFAIDVNRATKGQKDIVSVFIDSKKESLVETDKNYVGKKHEYPEEKLHIGKNPSFIGQIDNFLIKSSIPENENSLSHYVTPKLDDDKLLLLYDFEDDPKGTVIKNISEKEGLDGKLTRTVEENRIVYDPKPATLETPGAVPSEFKSESPMALKIKYGSSGTKIVLDNKAFKLGNNFNIFFKLKIKNTKKSGRAKDFIIQEGGNSLNFRFSIEKSKEFYKDENKENFKLKTKAGYASSEHYLGNRGNSDGEWHDYHFVCRDRNGGGYVCGLYIDNQYVHHVNFNPYDSRNNNSSIELFSTSDNMNDPGGILLGDLGIYIIPEKENSNWNFPASKLAEIRSKPTYYYSLDQKGGDKLFESNMGIHAKLTNVTKDDWVEEK